MIDFILHIEPQLAGFFAAHGTVTYGLLAAIMR